MSNTVISVEHLTKRYDLGIIGTGTLSRDLNRWWARLRGKPDPYTRIGQRDHFERIGETILALDDISFTVQQGEALGIIGKNGAGKSTLLKILSRVTAPTRGVVKVKGRIGSLLEVGTGFHPELTGRENIYLNGAILGMRKEEVQKKFDEIVDFSGVEQFIDTPVKRYSSGMYVRLAFAVAAHLDPEILVVDEVLAVGDAEFQKKCLGKMGDVAGEGRTVLFVSHNMVAIESLCRDAILLESGIIKSSGPSNQIIHGYLEQNQSIGIIKTANKSVKFLGVQYKEMRIDDDISLDLPFEVGPDNLEDVAINIAIVNLSGIKIMRLQSDLVNDGFYLVRNKKHIISFYIKSPSLAPGKYSLEIYMRNSNRVIFWTRNLPVFKIKPSARDEHNKLYYDQIGYIMPKFSLSCQKIE